MIALGIGIQHFLELGQHLAAHAAEALHGAAGAGLVHGLGALGDVLGKVADALEVRRDLDGGDGFAQVDRHGLTQGDQAQGLGLDVHFQLIDLLVRGNSLFGEGAVAAGDGVDGIGKLPFRKAAHAREALIDPVKGLFEG